MQPRNGALETRVVISSHFVFDVVASIINVVIVRIRSTDKRAFKDVRIRIRTVEVCPTAR
jgi:hypothetical protein